MCFPSWLFLLCVAPSWCWFMRLVVVLLVVGLLVLLSPLFLVRHDQVRLCFSSWFNAECHLVGVAVWFSAPGGYASGWLCAIQLVRLLRASLVSSLPVRPSVVRVSCRRSSLVGACATASRLICPSSCLFAFIVAVRVSPPGVVRCSCRWQSACSCFLRFIFSVGYDVELRGFLRLLVRLGGGLLLPPVCLSFIFFRCFSTWFCVFPLTNG